ncbi:MAG: DUF4174 domain-containing protein [Akkermansiaceae bacterium]|nr:DUF4174 domain-containing protein [Akkermansiaceae bacterium]
MHRFALLLLTLLMTANAAPDALDEHRWKHRLILVQAADDKFRQQLQAQWKENMAGVKDRDLMLIDLSPETLDLERTVRPDPKAIIAIRKWAEIANPDAPHFILVGKDGGIKGRQQGELDLLAYFALIDTMPMRQREMREQE